MFDGHHRAVLNELEQANLARVAAEAAERERLQRERLEFLGAINQALNEATDMQELMASVTKAAVPRLGDWCAIHVVRPDAAVPDVVINHADPAMVTYARQLQARFPYDSRATTGVPYVIRTGQTEFYPEIDDEVMSELDATSEERRIVAQLGLRSAITVPMIKRAKVVGAIQFVMSASSRHYTEEDVTLAQTIAGRVASSVENHRLNAEQRDIAQTLQRSLLPDSIPDIPGIDVAVRYRAAGEGNEVGGDFYDLFSLETPGRCAVVIGDVCGKGPAAAALTGLARHTIRTSAWHGDNPSEVLASLNQAMRRGSVDSFLTAVYALLDTSQPNVQLTVACAGHPLPVHVSTEGSRFLGAHGTLLGPFDDISVDPRSTTLEVGDVVVFYTDGATDLPPPFQLDDADFARLVETAAEGASTSEEIADYIVGALDEILSFDRRSDDIALLVLRISSGGPTV